MEPLFFGLDEVLAIHRDQIERYGGAPGLRDVALLEAAVAAARAGTKEGFLHPDLFEMAAAYVFHLVRDHPFVDGNKRVGLAAGLVFLELHGIGTRTTNDDLHDLVLRVAAGRVSLRPITDFLRSHADR